MSQAPAWRPKYALAAHLREWRKITPATDAREFAALAAKRWFYYAREGATVASLDAFHAADNGVASE